MEQDDIAQKLRAAGYSQGDLLPALSQVVVFDPEHPVSGVSRRASHEKSGTVSQPGRHPHGVGSRLMKAAHQLVIASQTCHVVRDVRDDPTVICFRAFETSDQRILSDARSNSSVRFFLLNDHGDRGLVADAVTPVIVEKPLLLTVERRPATTDPAALRRFGRWVARRFNRPALDDEVVHHVVRPIIDDLRHMQAAGDPLLLPLCQVRGIRMAHLNGPPPYEVRLLFLVDPWPNEEVRRRIQAELAPVVGRMQGWFGEGPTSLVAWDLRHLYNISVGELLDGTDPIYLDEFSFQGTSMVGLPPADHIDEIA